MATNFWRVKKGINFEQWADVTTVPLPDESDLAYESQSHKFKYYNGTVWKELGAGAGVNNYIASYDGNSTVGWKMYKDAASATPTDGTGSSVSCSFVDSTDSVTHSLGTVANGTPVTFATISSTTGISTYTTYYVINTASNTFQLAATVGGSLLPLTTDGTGTMVVGSAFVVSMSSPLRTPASFVFIKSATDCQGQGVAFDITIDSADTNKLLYLEFDYDFTDANYVSGDIVPFAINLGSSALTVMPAITNIKGKYVGLFASGSSTTYRVGFHIASTNATAWTALKIDNVVASEYIKDKPDWKLMLVTADGKAQFAGGFMKLQNGQYIATNSTATDMLYTLPSTPTANHTYYAYVDLYALGSAVAINGVVAKDASSAIVLFDGGLSNSTTRTNSPEQINASRYVHVGTFFPTTTSWNNCLAIGNNYETKNLISGIFGAPENSLKTLVYTDSLTGSWTHGLSGEPQSVSVYFYDTTASKKYPLDMPSYITNKTSTAVTYDFTGLSMVSGDLIEIRAIYVPVTGGQYVSISNRFESAWYSSAGPTTLAHGLNNIDDIRSYCVLAWDTSLNQRRLIDTSGLVINYDGTNFYLDWTSLDFTNTSYKIISGGTPLPSALPTKTSFLEASDFGTLNATGNITNLFTTSSSTLGSTQTLTLPAASTTTGKLYIVKRLSGTDQVKIVVSGGGTIDNVSSYTLTTAYESAMFISNGTQYYIL